MTSLTPRRFISVLALNLILAAVAAGQRPVTSTWHGAAQELVNTKHTLFIVTIAQPTRRHKCIMSSINDSEIVCEHHGHKTAFHAADVAALIFPGKHSRWYLYAAAFLVAAVASTWGTVVLAPICPACAVATGVAALFLYLMAPASPMMTDGDSPDRLFYVAAGQTLQVRLH